MATSRAAETFDQSAGISYDRATFLPRSKNGEAERREDLNEEQRGRSLRSRGEKAFERFHRALLSLAVPGDVKPPIMPGAKNRRVNSSAETCQDLLPDPQFSHVIGNILQDEKIPGIHIAFGHPDAEHTGQTWLSKTHIDCVGRDFDIWFDDEQVMKRGKFLI